MKKKWEVEYDRISDIGVSNMRAKIIKEFIRQTRKEAQHNTMQAYKKAIKERYGFLQNALSEKYPENQHYKKGILEGLNNALKITKHYDNSNS